MIRFAGNGPLSTLAHMEKQSREQEELTSKRLRLPAFNRMPGTHERTKRFSKPPILELQESV